MTSRIFFTYDYLSDVRSEKALSSMVLSEMDSQIRSLCIGSISIGSISIGSISISIVTSSQPLIYGLARVTWEMR